MSSTQTTLPAISYPLSFQSTGASLPSFFTRRPLFSIACSLFLQNTRGGGTSANPRHASLPPSYAPRDASIPCTLTRLRILPVTTGVYTFANSSVAPKPQKCLSVSPLFATLTHSLSRNSFPCHSYANTRDGGTTVVSQSFFFSALQNQQLTTNNCKLLERGKREEAMG